MSILLGNLSIEDMEKRCGVKFPKELVAFMKPRRQNDASVITHGKWHCFDIPFSLVCGDMQTAKEIYKYLSPMAQEFNEPLQISLEKSKR